MGQPSSPRSPAPPRWRRWALGALGPLALAAILARVDRPALAATLGRADPWLLALAYLTPLPAIGIRTLRWRRLLGAPGAGFGTGELLVLYARAVALGALTPGRVGELVKAGPIAARGLGLPRALASVVVDRLWDLACLVGLAACALPLLGQRLARPDWVVAGVLCVVGLAAAALLAAGAGGRRLRRWLPALAADGPLLPRGSTAACAGLTAASWAITLAASWLYARALGIPVGYLEMCALAALCSLVASLPISIAGAGTRDATLLLVLGPLGIGRAEALGLSLLMLSNTLFVGAVCSGAFLLRTGAPGAGAAPSAPPGA
jgi:uncharacterized membrane protein YbhN (UPF0104 family)